MEKKPSPVTLHLKPAWLDDRVNALEIELHQQAPQCPRGETLMAFSREAFFRPFNRLLTPVVIEDALGALPCEESRQETGSYYLDRVLRPTRPSRGDLRVRYTVAIDPGQANPLYDLGSEPGGAAGSGMTFLPRLWGERLDVRLSWDLSGLPPGCAGVWTYGRGDSGATIEPEALRQAAFAVGRLEWVEQDNFGFYWFPSSRLAGREIGSWMAGLFARMAGFFGDEGGPYRIVTRCKDYAPGELGVGKSYGGTALTRSYLWVYDRANPPAPQALRHLFPHEAVHNWVFLGDGSEPFGTYTWYLDGMAEYYSALLPYRYGLLSRAELLDMLNARCRRYYQNPHIHTSNLECGRLLFKDSHATRIPYGRGFLYLTGVDGQIRDATHGQRCLDDVVMAILRRQRAGETADLEVWLEETGRLTGRDMRPQLQEMAAGGDLVPRADCYGGELQVVKTCGAMPDGTGCIVYQYT